MRPLVIIGAVTLLFGCSTFGPGMDMDEGKFESTARHPDGGTEGQTFKVIPITGELIKQQAAHEITPQTRDISAQMQQDVKAYEYRVGPHDILSVTVWDHPELTIPAGEFRAPEQAGHLVDSNGNMYFPYIGIIHVGGMTVEEVRAALAQRLAKYIEKAQLDVNVAAFRSQRVQVIGQVATPGFLPITDVPMSALEAINLAHGYTQFADPTNVTLVRKGVPNHLDLQALTDFGDLSQNWLLQAGDAVIVGDSTQNKVFVMGEVQKPQILPMVKARLTIADALGGVGGVDQLTSNPGRIYVIRGTFDRPEIYRLDSSSADALLLAVSFQLKPLDVVYVSTYELTKWNRVFAQIAPTIQILYQAAFSAAEARTLFK
jgi:polysaccharide export outer membrane protein